MSSPTKTTANPLNRLGGESNDNRNDNRNDNHNNKLSHHGHTLPMPGLSGNPNGPVGNLLKGAMDHEGNLKDASLCVGIKLDLEAEVHLTARVRGDIIVGLY